jgi:hypothetical protein
MKAITFFFRTWLLLCFALSFFVIPLYLVAIYPDVPQPYFRMMRGLGYGVIKAQPSELGYWYRLVGCAAVIVLGLLMVRKWAHDVTLKRDASSSKNISESRACKQKANHPIKKRRKSRHG